MDKLSTTGTNSKKIWILMGLALVIIIITIVAATSSQTKQTVKTNPVVETPAATTTTSTEAQVANKTQVDAAIQAVPSLKDASQDVPGSVNLVTKDNKVVNLQGQAVQTNVAMTAPTAPQQTGPIADKASLSAKVIKIDMSLEKGISPASFTVAKGAAVSLAVSSIDQWTHIFKFEDASLSAVAIGVSTGETRGMTFNAPTKAGEYKYFCDLPGHAARGEVGKMIVK